MLSEEMIDVSKAELITVLILVVMEYALGES